MARNPAQLASKEIDHGAVSFETEGRLLQELGERLVASPEVALVELIKNAFDADARTCEIDVFGTEDAVEVRDDGHGMAFDQFANRWMRIATSHKVDEKTSPTFGRRRTGQKGIGRFAVRFLGSKLRLISVAFDDARKSKTRLEVDFDWRRIDSSSDLRSAKIPYTLFTAADDAQTGTTLRIEGLKQGTEFIATKAFRTSVLRIVSPLESLDRGRFGRSDLATKEDPGFRVLLPGAQGKEEEVDLGAQVLAHAWARLRIDLKGNTATFDVSWADRHKRSHQKVRLKSQISNGLYADIRFFPRRAGVFRGTEFIGSAAWGWVRENCGVAVVDHGFRIKPYGFEDDDWLSLDVDAAHNRRDWRSSLSEQNFPIPPALRSKPGDNPALNVPNNFQLVGAVFVESAPPALSAQGDDLTPSMDREGYLENAAYRQLVDVVRAGIEYLALVDKQDLLERQEAKAKEATKRARADFRAAIQWIKESKTLTRGDKARLVEHYAELASKLDEVEEYDREARRKLETMGLLGVVAGFMTHEAARILDGLERAIEKIRGPARQDKNLAQILRELQEGYRAFKSYVDYTSTFVEALHRQRDTPFKSAAQVRRIIERFKDFAEARGIKVVNEIDGGLETPAVSVTMYSGVLLNLYTNALKAVLAAQHRADAPHIVFKGWNERKKHIVEVLDKGIGIPEDLQKRVFDPLFTTTSNLNNPLGSGMGLGLSLIREVVRHSGGTVRIVKPPRGFSTCFRVELPTD